jgi:hypothetical protein
MGQRLSAATVVPHGFVVERVDEVDAGSEMLIRSAVLASLCPACDGRSAKVHSRYERHLGDLPLAGEEDWRWTVCSRRISRDVVALFRPDVAPDASLAEAYEAVSHDIRATAALRLEALGGAYEPPLVITAEDYAAWLRAGQPDGDLEI